MTLTQYSKAQYFAAKWLGYPIHTQAQVDHARDAEVMARHEEKAAHGLTPAARIRMFESL